MNKGGYMQRDTHVEWLQEDLGRLMEKSKWKLKKDGRQSDRSLFIKINTVEECGPALGHVQLHVQITYTSHKSS